MGGISSTPHGGITDSDLGRHRRRQDPPPLRRDDSGRRLLSRRIANDEPELLQLLSAVLALGDHVTWGIDLADGGAALALAILLNHDQPVHYISGRAIRRASESYRGEGKTDAKDAAVIADQVCVRRDLQPLRATDDTITDMATAATVPGRRLC
ncbi:transposase [Streptomyces chartreusis]|uniref:IS110 family transposase n=1 Tax=Streptomyces chartreusis TaxID=1969 RepID=UPI003869E93F